MSVCWNDVRPGCRVEVRALSGDPQAPSAGALIAWADPCGDGGWYMCHCDGRRLRVGSTVELVERMIGVATDVSLAEGWRREAGRLPAGSQRADTLRRCAQELAAAAGQGCCGSALPATAGGGCVEDTPGAADGP